MSTRTDVDALIEELGIGRASQQLMVAGILLSYRCSITCKHCLFGCAGNRPNTVMTARECADNLGLLHATGRVVHIAGGEAMLFWDIVAEAIELAHTEGNAPHFLETNCSFAINDEIVRERFRFMADHGVKGILASADPFHQEFVPAENFVRVRDIAFEIFGERHFQGPLQSPAELKKLETIVKDKAKLREYVRQSSLSYVGTAHHELAQYLDTYDPRDADLPVHAWSPATAEVSCRTKFEAGTMWEIHIDPYANIQTNCGIVLGKVPDTTPAQVLADGPEHANKFVEIVSEKGALGLADWAVREHDFQMPEAVTQTCELCYLTRAFLHPLYPDVFGPGELFG